MTGLCALAATAALLAGCLGPGPADDDPDGPGPAGLAFGTASGLPSAPQARDLTEAPLWAAGEWWTYRVEAPPYGETDEVTVVVAGADETHYYVAQPAHEEKILPFIMHIPATGEVDRTDLSHEAHDAPWKLLDFPLKTGRSWSGVYWGGAEMQLNVVSAEDGRATVELTSDGRSATLVYHAETGNLESYEETNDDGVRTLGVRLLDHGYNHQGPVRIGYGQDLLVCHGVAAGALEVADCSVGDPNTPQGEFTIPPGYDNATLALVVNPGLVQDQSAPGSYRIAVTDPHGSRQEMAHTPTPGGGGSMMFLRVNEPAGTWSWEGVAVGPGFAIVEGVAHNTLEVRLPSGCVQSGLLAGLDLVACGEAGDE